MLLGEVAGEEGQASNPGLTPSSDGTKKRPAEGLDDGGPEAKKRRSPQVLS